MADDRSGPGSDEVHDDDELADVLAAELERYATGAVPVIARPADAPAAPQAEHEVPAPAAPVSFRRPLDHGQEGPPGPRETPFDSGRGLLEDAPIRRRSGYRAPRAGAPSGPPDRVLPTAPVALPEPTAALLQEMVADTGDDRDARRARHAAPPVPSAPGNGMDAGKAVVPDRVYAEWEQSLRSIGRPPDAWRDEDLVPGAGIDAPTIALPVRRTGPLPVDRPPDAELRDDDRPARGRSGRRRAEVPARDPVTGPAELVTTGSIPITIGQPAAVADGWEDEGIDDVDAPHERVSAATTGSIDLPSIEPRPRTGPLFVERVRTAILAVPTGPEGPTGSRAVAVAARWAGAFASPLALLVAFGLATAGAGPLAAAAAIAGAGLALPAALRSATWAATASTASREEDLVFGRRGGTAWAAVLLVARLAAVAVVLSGIAALAGAWIARTGALGVSGGTASVIAAIAAAAVAILVAAIPVRAAAIVVQLLAITGAFGTVLLLLLLGPGATPTAGTLQAVPAAAAAGFAGVGLVVVLSIGDVVRWRTSEATTVGSAAATLLAVVVGGLLLAGGVLIGAGATGDPVDALTGTLSDGTAQALAAPLAVLLIAATLTAPALLIRSAGAAATRLLGRGGGSAIGSIAAGLLGLAGALGLVAAGIGAADAAVSVAGLVGVPVAAWAGLRTVGAERGGGTALVGVVVGTVVGWSLCGGLLLGLPSPLVAALHIGAVGPAIGLAVAVLAGAVTGAVSRGRTPGAIGVPVDTVDA